MYLERLTSSPSPPSPPFCMLSNKVGIEQQANKSTAVLTMTKLYTELARTIAIMTRKLYSQDFRDEKSIHIMLLQNNISQMF